MVSMKSRYRSVLAVGVVLCTCPWIYAQSAQQYLQRPDDWFRSLEGIRIASNILSWQSPQGSWPKNISTTQTIFTGDPNTLQGTFDNSATVGEMRFLAKAFNLTKDKEYEQAFLKGLRQILLAQYPTGGWPQFYPPSSQYHRHITFNDGTMVRLMQFLRDVASLPDFAFVDADLRKSSQAAFDRGIMCILKCQIRVNDRLTVWCAQHDEKDYSPRSGRTYELVSLSGAESADILKLLMSLKTPSPEVVASIKAGAAWFESSRVTGLRQSVVNGDRTMIADPNAPALWARFYEIETNKPIFSGRDGVKKYNMSEIEPERRNGYSWYGNWGRSVAEAFDQWKQAQEIQKSPISDPNDLVRMREELKLELEKKMKALQEERSREVRKRPVIDLNEIDMEKVIADGIEADNIYFKDRVFGLTFRGLAISIAAIKDNYEIGDEIEISCLFKNFSQKEARIRIYRDQNQRDFRYALYFSDGNSVPKSEFNENFEANYDKPPTKISTSRIDLRPREIALYPIKIGRFFKIEKEGTYSLVIMSRITESWEDGFMISNMIKINIVNKKGD